MATMSLKALVKLASGAMLLTLSQQAIAQTGTPLMILVNDTGSVDRGWVLRDDNTRQTIEKSCIRALRKDGLLVSRVSWSTINDLNAAPSQSCNKIGRHVKNRKRPLLLAVSLEPDTGGWVIYPNNKRVRVNTTCLRQLEARNIDKVTAKRDHIIALARKNNSTCEQLIATLTGVPSGGGSSSSSGGGNPAPVEPVTNWRGFEPFPRYNENCLGMNDGHANSWDGGTLTTDAIKSSRGPLREGSGDYSTMDADRWPVGNQSSYFAIGEGDQHDLHLMNPWVLLPYEQSGHWLSGPDNRYWKVDGARYLRRFTHSGVVGHVFEINEDAVNVNLVLKAGAVPPSPKNRWHLVPLWAAYDYANAMKEENFRYIFDTDKYAKRASFPLLHKQTVAQMESFCRIRFMLGDGINTLDFSGRMADRTKPSHPTFTTLSGDGIPYEWEVWIANHLNVGLWHVDHVKTWDAWRGGDSYLWNQATYMRDNLRGNLIREYGNEIWNMAFPFGRQTTWVWDNGPYDEASRDDWQWMNYNYGRRAWDTAGVWDQVYASRRDDLDLTVSIQTAVAPDAQLGRFTSPYGQSFGDRIDSVSGTFYFGETLVPDNNLFRSVLRDGVDAITRHHRVNLNLVEARLNWSMNLYRPYATKWHLYEGSSHMNILNYNSNNADHRKVYRALRSFFNSQDYTDILTEFSGWWGRHWASGEWMWFHLTGTETAVEPWGYYYSTGNPTPVFAGSRNFINSYSNY